MTKPVARRPREYVTPFLRGKVWWVRVPRINAAPVPRSLGISGKENRDKAVAVCEFLRWLRARQDAWLLDQLAAGKAPIARAYRAYLDNRLPEFVAELRDGVNDPDLEPLVEAWQKELARVRKPNADTRAKYLVQVRSLIPEGKPFPKSKLTVVSIAEWLGGLGIGQPNRYRAALSSFAKFLIFRGLLSVNPVVLVPMTKESEPRTVHLSQDECRRLLDALPQPFKAFHALMLSTGMEFAAARAVNTGDVGDKQVFAKGTKRASRRRTVGVYDRWLWAWQIFWDFALEAPMSGHIFTGIGYDSNRWALQKALEAAKLPADYTTHDHRHTWAVQAIRDRIPRPMISHNLGHRDAAMLDRVYGRFIPTGADFAAIRTISSTAALPSGGIQGHAEANS